MCESLRPGTTVRPPRSIARVVGPRKRCTCWSSATDSKRPPAIATAVAVGRDGSIVAKRPLVRTRSACWTPPAVGCGTVAPLASETGDGTEPDARALHCAPRRGSLPLDDLRLLRGLRRLVHHRVGVLDARPVRAGVLAQDRHQRVVVLLVGPVALPLEQRRDRREAR